MKLVIQMVRVSLSFLKECLDLVSPLSPFLAIATKKMMPCSFSDASKTDSISLKNKLNEPKVKDVHHSVNVWSILESVGVNEIYIRQS